MTETTVNGPASIKQAKKASQPKVRRWTFNNVSDRDVANALNKLSADGSVVFGVYQSLSIGGTYGVLSYKDETKEE